MNSNPVTHHSVPTLKTIKAAYPEVRALFFDMDGTLFDTEPYHTDALKLMAQKYKIIPPHDVATLHEMMIGKADYLVYDIMKDWDGFPSHWKTSQEFIEEKNENLVGIFKSIDPAEYFLAETFSLLKEAKEEGIFLALITMSEKLVTEELLRIADVRDYFQIILTRDDCEKHKPDPWPYLEAMKSSSLKRHEVLIFEDSQVGLQAALASGANVIKVGWY